MKLLVYVHHNQQGMAVPGSDFILGVSLTVCPELGLVVTGSWDKAEYVLVPFPYLECHSVFDYPLCLYQRVR